jgi:riboflavin synthase
MFTGLIAEVGTVAARQQRAAGAMLAIRAHLAEALSEGDSIAVSGVCLTATAVRDGCFEAEAMAETLRRSTLGALATGAGVNLELPLRLDDRLGGHIVQGHVDGVGSVSEVGEHGIARVLRIDTDPRLARYLVEKGSVAVDGVSLTVSALHDRGFEVSLIPETLRRTNLGAAGPGDRLNLEVDMLAKHVERLLSARQETVGAPSQDRSEPPQDSSDRPQDPSDPTQNPSDPAQDRSDPAQDRSNPAQDPSGRPQDPPDQPGGLRACPDARLEPLVAGRVQGRRGPGP